MNGIEMVEKLTEILPDTSYKLFNILNDCRQKWKLSAGPADVDLSESIIEYLEDCFTYDELHQTLVARTRQLFGRLDSYVPEDNTIFMIKDYIAKNYSNDLLSIKEISGHVKLSASYVCTYFKNQTGQTLNQYLTEYRMEKAMRLLEDARNQIADISAKVGYSNGNYFSKSFKVEDFAQEVRTLVQSNLIRDIRLYMDVPDQESFFSQSTLRDVAEPMDHVRRTYWYGIFAGSRVRSSCSVRLFIWAATKRKHLGILRIFPEAG